MKFNIVLNGVIVSKEIPTGWHMVTFRQWRNLSKAIKDANDLGRKQIHNSVLISIFTNIDPELIAVAKIKNFEVLMSQFAFMAKPMNPELPATVFEMAVPSRIEEEASARYGDVQEIVNKFVEHDNIGNMSYYPNIVASYLTPSPYDYKQAENLAERLWDAPCAEVMAIGNFTLILYNAWRNGMLNSSHLEGTLRNRMRRGIVLWLNRLAFSIRYFTWKRSLPSSARNFLNGR